MANISVKFKIDSWKTDKLDVMSGYLFLSHSKFKKTYEWQSKNVIITKVKNCDIYDLFCDLQNKYDNEYHFIIVTALQDLFWRAEFLNLKKLNLKYF